MSGTDSRRSSGSAHRRVRVTLALALVAALLVAAGCAGLPARTGSDARTVQIIAHEVGPGETLASIADDFYGDSDAATYIRNVNGIPWDSVPDVGALLEIPVGAEDIERYERRTEAKILYNRGTTHAEAGDLERAAEDFRAALRADPRFVDAGYNLGVVLLRSGEPARAAAILEQVVRVREDDPDIEYALGSARLDAGNAVAALASFDETLALDPGHEAARFSKALALLELDRDDEAIFQLDLYLREFPGGEWSRSARETLAILGAGRGVTD